MMLLLAFLVLIGFIVVGLLVFLYMTGHPMGFCV